MTRRSLHRIIALLLVPALIADPATVMGSVGAGLVPARKSGRTQGPPLQSLFTAQALAPELRGMQRSRPFFSPKRGVVVIAMAAALLYGSSAFAQRLPVLFSPAPASSHAPVMPINPDPFPAAEDLPDLPPGVHPPATEKELEFAQQIRCILAKDDPAFASIPILIGTVSNANESESAIAVLADKNKRFPLAYVVDPDWSRHLTFPSEDYRELTLQFLAWHDEFHLHYILPYISWRNAVAWEFRTRFYPESRALPKDVEDLVVEAMRIQHDLRAQADAKQKLKQGYRGMTRIIFERADFYIDKHRERYQQILRQLTTTIGREGLSKKEWKRLQNYLDGRLSEPGELSPKPVKSKKSHGSGGPAAAAPFVPAAAKGKSGPSANGAPALRRFFIRAAVLAASLTVLAGQGLTQGFQSGHAAQALGLVGVDAGAALGYALLATGLARVFANAIKPALGMGVYDHALRPERMVAAIIAVATLPASVVVVAFRSLVHLKLLGIPEEAGAFLLIATIALPFVLPPAGLALEGDRGFVVTKAKRIAALILTWGILWTYYLAPALIRAAVSLSGTLRRPVLVGALVWLTALVRHGFAQGLQAASGTVMTQAPRTPPTWEIGSIVALVALFTMAVLWMLLMIVPFWDPPVRVTHALFMGDSSKDPEKRKLKNYWLTMEGDWAEQSLRWRWNRYTLPWKIALAFVSTAALAAAILIGIQVNLGRFPDAGTLQILLMVTSAASFFGIPLALRGKGGWRNVWAVEDKKGVLADVRALMASSRNRLINLLLAGGAASTALILWSLLSLAATTPKPPSATENIPHVMVTTAAAKQPGLEGAA